MSKNFELLQKLGKEQDLINSPAPGNGPAPLSPARTAAASSPVIKPGLEEINSFVQQVFLIAGERFRARWCSPAPSPPRDAVG